MNEQARDLWERAGEALRAAEAVVSVSADAAASRAYYAAFYAVSALFALNGRTFRKHSAVEAAVHRDLVRDGEWNKGLGATYSELLRLREVGDYGGGRHVTAGEAEEATADPRRIIAAVRRLAPDRLPPVEQGA